MERADLASADLLAQVAWVRRLARALVGDAATADDLAQDTFAIAHVQQPDPDRPLRPWLGRVVQNLVRTRRRAAARRVERGERFEASRDPVPTPHELVERVELQRAVADEVLALAEPYRSTVLLHYVEGLRLADIARRLGIPEGTVRRRLKTALDQLRGALRARSDTTKRNYLLALVPLAHGGATAPIGALAMKKGIGFVVILLLLVGGAAWWARGHGTRTAARTGSPPAAGARGSASMATGGSGGDGSARVTATPPAAGAHVAGHVLAHGQPVAGARVQLGSVLTGEPVAVVSAAGVALAAVATVTTGPDGAFDFGTPPAAAYRVSATAAELTPSSIDVSTVDPTVARDHLELELGDCTRRLAGTISDASGGPIAHARIVVAGLPTTETDDAGHYRTCVWTSPEDVGLPTVIVRIDAEGYGSIVYALFASSDMHRDFFLVPAAGLAGTVTTAAGAAIAGARVVATPDPSELSRHAASGWATTDVDGTFHVANLGPGVYQLVATTADLATRTPVAAIARPASTSSSTRLVVEPRAPVAADAPPVAKLHGHVTRHGRPVASARVLYERMGGDATAPSITDGQGAYALAVSTPGPLRVTAWDPATGAFADYHAAEIAAGDDLFVDLDLDRAGEVAGIVVDAQQRPVPAVYVRMDLANGAEDFCETTTDAKGTFVCPMLVGGDYQPTVAPSPRLRAGFAPVSGSALPIVHVPADGRVTVTLAVIDDRVTIEGRVVDDRGQAVPDVYVEAVGTRSDGVDSPAAMTDGAGRFAIGNLARTTYNVHAHAADGSDAELLDIDGGRHDVAITLARAGAVDGTLVGFSSPPRVLTTTLTPDLRMGGFANVEADGRSFSQIGLPPGRYTVEAKAAGEVDGVTIEIRPGETSHVTLTARGLGRVSGTLTELGSHAPVVGFRCDANPSLNGQMSGSPPDVSQQSMTDAAGHFEMPAPVGPVRVFCLPLAEGRLSRAGADVEVVAGKTAVVTAISVRETFTGAPHEVPFSISQMILPITITQVHAGAAGLRAGDLLVSIDGHAVAGLLPDGAATLIANHAAGTPLVLVVSRGGQLQTVTIP